MSAAIDTIYTHQVLTIYTIKKLPCSTMTHVKSDSVKFIMALCAEMFPLRSRLVYIPHILVVSYLRQITKLIKCFYQFYHCLTRWREHFILQAFIIYGDIVDTSNFFVEIDVFTQPFR